MHIEQINIKRLLGFRQLRMDVDPQLQLIAGPNNAGKSSLIRVLETFFADPSSEDMLQLKPLHDYYAESGPRTMSSIKVHFGGLAPEEAEEVKDLVSRDGTFWVEIKCTRLGKISYGAYRADPSRAREVYLWVLQSLSFVKIPSVRVSADEQAERDQSLARLHETLEGVLVRSGRSRATQLQQDFAKVIAPVEDLVRRVLNESVAAVAAELPFREPGLGVNLPASEHALRGMLSEAVITSSEGVEVPITERGTGFQSAMVLGILRYVSSRRQSGAGLVFAIEEPEAFLHPQTQRAMAKILRDVSAEAQVLVTTHSPVLVDSFSVRRIVRLPLSPEGMTYDAFQQDLTVAEEGRLTRYCDATNSELVFASAVILVEGHGDKLLIDYLLERITGGAGGHYALGITVIEASGIGTIPHLIRLAELYGVRAYVITDKDGVHNNGQGKRVLLEILKAKAARPTQRELAELRELADDKVRNLKAALAQQAALNEKLDQWDAFVLSSDLEGLLLDTVQQKQLAQMLGPEGENQIGKTEVETFSEGKSGRDAMASWLGSKGWNSDRKASGKAKPHLPSALLREHLSARSVTRAIQPLYDWLATIVADHERSPL